MHHSNHILYTASLRRYSGGLGISPSCRFFYKRTYYLAQISGCFFKLPCLRQCRRGACMAELLAAASGTGAGQTDPARLLRQLLPCLLKAFVPHCGSRVFHHPARPHFSVPGDPEGRSPRAAFHGAVRASLPAFRRKDRSAALPYTPRKLLRRFLPQLKPPDFKQIPGRFFRCEAVPGVPPETYRPRPAGSGSWTRHTAPSFPDPGRYRASGCS